MNKGWRAAACTIRDVTTITNQIKTQLAVRGLDRCIDLVVGPLNLFDGSCSTLAYDWRFLQITLKHEQVNLLGAVML